MRVMPLGTAIPFSAPLWGRESSTSMLLGLSNTTAPFMGLSETPLCRGRTAPLATKAARFLFFSSSRIKVWSSARSATSRRTFGFRFL